MTLTAAAYKVLAGAESGVLENMDEPLRTLNALLQENAAQGDLSSALAILNEARKAAYAHRRQIVVSLEQLQRTAVYGQQTSKTSSSWQFSG